MRASSYRVFDTSNPLLTSRTSCLVSYVVPSSCLLPRFVLLLCLREPDPFPPAQPETKTSHLILAPLCLVSRRTFVFSFFTFCCPSSLPSGTRPFRRYHQRQHRAREAGCNRRRNQRRDEGSQRPRRTFVAYSTLYFFVAIFSLTPPPPPQFEIFRRNSRFEGGEGGWIFFGHLLFAAPADCVFAFFPVRNCVEKSRFRRGGFLGNLLFTVRRLPPPPPPFAFFVFFGLGLRGLEKKSIVGGEGTSTVVAMSAREHQQLNFILKVSF